MRGPDHQRGSKEAQIFIRIQRSRKALRKGYMLDGLQKIIWISKSPDGRKVEEQHRQTPKADIWAKLPTPDCEGL